MRSERSLSRFVLTGLTIGFIALLAAGSAVGWFVLKAQDHTEWVEHTYEVERRVSMLRVLVERLEVARRGYLLSHHPQTRQTFIDTVKTEPALIADLTRLTADNAAQQRRLAVVSALSAMQYRLLATSMVVSDRDPVLAAATFARDQSLGVTRRLRRLTADMLREENRLLNERSALQRRTIRVLFATLALAGVVALVVAICSLLVMRRYTGSLIEARAAERLLNAELERRVAERTHELSRANEEIQRFAYIVSHDLRSPLVNVMGFTGELEASARPLAQLIDRLEAEAPELLDRDAAIAAREDLPEALGFIRTSTQKMDRLINAILRLSREGKRVLAPQPIDLAVLLAGIVDALRHRLDEIGAEVAIERPMPELVADRLAVEQMLSNLIENAVKYLKPDVPGRIVASARTRGDRIAISIADNGRGIDPRDHDRIFDLFRRSGRQDQPGEGIGLAHVRALAYRLGGLIDCTSTLGEGATFTLSLPVRPAPQG